MKSIHHFLFVSGLVFLTAALSGIEARDLTYKFGVGYRQAFTNIFVGKGTHADQENVQMNGLEASYGLAKDIQVGAFYGFGGNFHRNLLGPKLRYDFHRLFNRDAAVWNHLNLFTEVSFLVKYGSRVETGITMHAPDIGFEILPFDNNNFAILTAAGLVIDMNKTNRVGFTNGMFGDVGVKYYF